MLGIRSVWNRDLLPYGGGLARSFGTMLVIMLSYLWSAVFATLET